MAVRTTLDLDDDVVAAARELAASERRSLGSVISELARRGLTPVRSRLQTAGDPRAARNAADHA
jgi:hypothetical protein